MRLWMVKEIVSEYKSLCEMFYFFIWDFMFITLFIYILSYVFE